MAFGDLLAAVALLMVLEGILPATTPETFRRVMRQAAEMDDTSLRAIGWFAIIFGLLLLYWVRH